MKGKKPRRWMIYGRKGVQRKKVYNTRRTSARKSEGGDQTILGGRKWDQLSTGEEYAPCREGEREKTGVGKDRRGVQCNNHWNRITGTRLKKEEFTKGRGRRGLLSQMKIKKKNKLVGSSG